MKTWPCLECAIDVAGSKCPSCGETSAESLGDVAAQQEQPPRFGPLRRAVPETELREVLEELHQLGRPQTSWDDDHLEMAKETISRMIAAADRIEHKLREISGLCHEPEA